MRQSELVGQLGRYSTLGTENTDVLRFCPASGSLFPSSLFSPTPSPFIFLLLFFPFLSLLFPNLNLLVLQISNTATCETLNESEVEAESLKLHFYNW